jgi:type IV pilus assembly protein PilV
VRARPVGGFTLIEVLVSLFVLAVGIVGAAATQARAQATRHQSVLLSSATQLAASLAERMRANPVAMALPDAANPYLQLDYDSGNGAPAAPASSCYGDAACAPADMAAFDLFAVRRSLHSHFPGARVRICRDAAPWSGVAGSLSWQCDNGAGAPVVIKLGWRGKGERGAAAPFVPALAIVASGSVQ